MSALADEIMLLHARSDANVCQLRTVPWLRRGMTAQVGVVKRLTCLLAVCVRYFEVLPCFQFHCSAFASRNRHEVAHWSQVGRHRKVL